MKTIAVVTNSHILFEDYKFAHINDGNKYILVYNVDKAKGAKFDGYITLHGYDKIDNPWRVCEELHKNMKSNK